MTEPQDATWWAEIEESLGHLDAAQQALAGHAAPFGPTGNETTAVALHPSGRGPRGEILRQLDRIEYDLGRARSALQWMAIGLALEVGAAIVLVYALATRR